MRVVLERIIILFGFCCECMCVMGVLKRGEILKCERLRVYFCIGL